MAFLWNKTIVGGLLAFLWAFHAQADVQSLQTAYRKLLEKTVEVQTGKSISTEQLIYHLPEASLKEAKNLQLHSLAQSWNQANSLEMQPQILQALQVQLNNLKEKDLFNREALRKEPVTLIVVPGVFGEFIDPLAFNEVTGQQTSSLSRTFNQKIKEQLQTYGKCKTGTEAHCDYFFSLETMSLKQDLVSVDSLDQLLSVTSIDDQDGTELVRIVLFKTPRMSLESISKIQEVAAIFNRRLQKYFALHGAPSKYAYVGYSRGTMVALEMLRQSQDSRAKGLFVVGGVTLGSDLADQIHVPGTIVNLQLTALRRLADKLKLNHQLGFFEAGRVRLENFQAWTDFAQEMAAIPGAQDFLKSQMEKGKNSDPRSGVSLALSVAKRFGLMEQPAITHEAYSLNVARFKKFVEQAYLAVNELTTNERLKWWAQAKLPKNFTLYTFAATMADSQSASAIEADMGQKQWASGPFNGADFLGLIENYRDLRKASGASMNDSQVAVSKVIGWPKLINAINPQIEIKTQFLALFGAHHWAMALPVVNVNKDSSINPFPRSAFLESMAHVFASQAQGM